MNINTNNMDNIYIIIISYYIVCGSILVYFYLFLNSKKKLEIKSL